jgi:hypothetical protein|tara:strand:+ start:262 stop:1725 length:1464 start_codon:yes stop_codon:yes gene_type:complete
MRNTDFYKIGYGPKKRAIKRAKPFQRLQQGFVQSFARINAIKDKLFEQFPEKYNISKLDSDLAKAYTDRASILTEEFDKASDDIAKYSPQDERYRAARDTLNRVNSDMLEINKLFEDIAIRKGKNYTNDNIYAKTDDASVVANNNRIFDEKSSDYLFKNSYFNENNELIIKTLDKDNSYKDTKYTDLPERYIYKNIFDKADTRRTITSIITTAVRNNVPFSQVEDDILTTINKVLQGVDRQGNPVDPREIKELILTDDEYLNKYYEGEDFANVVENYDNEIDPEQYKKHLLDKARLEDSELRLNKNQGIDGVQRMIGGVRYGNTADYLAVYQPFITFLKNPKDGDFINDPLTKVSYYYLNGKFYTGDPESGGDPEKTKTIRQILLETGLSNELNFDELKELETKRKLEVIEKKKEEQVVKSQVEILGKTYDKNNLPTGGKNDPIPMDNVLRKKLGLPEGEDPERGKYYYLKGGQVGMFNGSGYDIVK